MTTRRGAAGLLVPLNYLWIWLRWETVFLLFLPLTTVLFLGSLQMLSAPTGGFVRKVASLQWILLVTVFALSHVVRLFDLPLKWNPAAGGSGLFLYLLLLAEGNDIAQALIYPSSFGEKYQTAGNVGENTLGMVGLKHLRGVMILSKPSLLGGFDNPSSKENMGVHEFAHLVEKGEAEHGLPPEVPRQVVKHWVQYVAQQLSHPAKNHAYINKYAYTNEHEFFAVLAEYFFKSPNLLQEKDPELYAMLREMFHQDTRPLLRMPSSGRQKYGRNAPCPCGSGKKYKHCCLLKTVEPLPRGNSA